MTRHSLNTDSVDYVLNACHYRHDWTSPEPLSHSVVQAIADCKQTDPGSGPPLSEAINTDSLDQLFTIYQSDDHCTDHIWFTHHDCTVVVYRDGHILVYPVDQNRPGNIDR